MSAITLVLHFNGAFKRELAFFVFLSDIST